MMFFPRHPLFIPLKWICRPCAVTWRGSEECWNCGAKGVLGHFGTPNNPYVVSFEESFDEEALTP